MKTSGRPLEEAKTYLEMSSLRKRKSLTIRKKQQLIRIQNQVLSLLSFALGLHVIDEYFFSSL